MIILNEQVEVMKFAFFIAEYEQMLADIQRNNLIVCPICYKEFLKRSKLVRHFHTHFSNYRPRYSCGNCGKLFTTQDWCKRHAISCQKKRALLDVKTYKAITYKPN